MYFTSSKFYTQLARAVYGQSITLQTRGLSPNLWLQQPPARSPAKGQGRSYTLSWPKLASNTRAEDLVSHPSLTDPGASSFEMWLQLSRVHCTPLLNSGTLSSFWSLFFAALCVEGLYCDQILRKVRSWKHTYKCLSDPLASEIIVLAEDVTSPCRPQLEDCQVVAPRKGLQRLK